MTDADLTLGYLNPGNFAGGTMSLDDGSGGRSRTGHRHAAGATTPQAAWTVHDVINETMARPCACTSRTRRQTRSGDDGGFGGAGLVHAYNLAASSIHKS